MVSVNGKAKASADTQFPQGFVEIVVYFRCYSVSVVCQISTATARLSYHILIYMQTTIGANRTDGRF